MELRLKQTCIPLGAIVPFSFQRGCSSLTLDITYFHFDIRGEMTALLCSHRGGAPRVHRRHFCSSCPFPSNSNLLFTCQLVCFCNLVQPGCKAFPAHSGHFMLPQPLEATTGSAHALGCQQQSKTLGDGCQVNRPYGKSPNQLGWALVPLQPPILVQNKIRKMHLKTCEIAIISHKLCHGLESF
jgi:hypothetical protein